MTTSDALTANAGVAGLMTAAVAARRLGVSRATLYAYVSRGLIRSVPAITDPRCRLYVSVDVETLVRQKALTRGPMAASAAALNLGLPILETRVSGIAGGRLVYRGQDALALAELHSVEAVAGILWQAEDRNPFAGLSFNPWNDRDWAWLAGSVEYASPTDRAQMLLSLLAIKPWFLAEQATPAAAARHVLAIGNAVVGAPLAPDVPLHEALAQAWNRPAASDVIRRALVLCAEHELNPSTFTVRVVMSTGATLSMALIAGLAALSGSRHGGMRPEFDAFFDERINGEDASPVEDRVDGDHPILGFGHPLYPDGDPRALALLRHLDVPAPLARVIAEIEQTAGLRPNLSLALWMIEKTHDLPFNTALALLAIGRTIGWIAHAIEQRETNTVVRPRARFIADKPVA